MVYFYPWNLNFGNMYYSTKHKQEKGLASSECCKRLADTATGYWDKPYSSFGDQHINPGPLPAVREARLVKRDPCKWG